MKIIYTYLFILLYVGALLRPLVPVIDYNLNYDYISKVLCINKDEPELKCNGKCHLSQELKKTIPNDSKDKPSPLPIIDFDKFPITKHDTNSYNFTFFEYSEKIKSILYKTGKTNDFNASVFQPPEFLV